MYLAGAGVGRIRICDFDTIDLSNLQRQLFFETGQTGKSKAGTLGERMRQLNPTITVEVIEELFTRRNAQRLLEGVDFVVEATDNPSSKYLVDEVCSESALPYCIGGVREFEGQIITCLPGTMRYAELFPDRPMEEGGFTPCSLGGVLGPAAGVVASVQAAETIKYITKSGRLLTDRLMMLDLLNGDVNIIRMS